jgi:hypothetical protein
MAKTSDSVSAETPVATRHRRNFALEGLDLEKVRHQIDALLQALAIVATTRKTKEYEAVHDASLVLMTALDKMTRKIKEYEAAYDACLVLMTTPGLSSAQREAAQLYLADVAAKMKESADVIGASIEMSTKVLELAVSVDKASGRK